MGTVTATLVVSLKPASGSGSTQGILKAEIDARPDGYNGGEVKFSAQSTPYMLLYKSTNVTLTNELATAGVLTKAASGTRQVVETLKFNNTQDASPGYPVASGFAYQWIGADLGALTLKDDARVQADKSGYAIAMVTYATAFDVWQLSNLPAKVQGFDALGNSAWETSYEVLAVFVGTAS